MTLIPKKTKVLVTGGAGFIGNEVVKQLLDKGYKVKVADNFSKKDARVPKEVEFFKVDLTDRKQAEKVMKGIDYCIHLAAKIGGIGYFHKFPATILSENNKLYSAVFEAAVKAKIKRIIYISSSMVFESTNRYPSREEDIYTIPPPLSAYGFSKLIGEWYCKAFKDEFGLNYTILRPFNAYGINEAPEREVGYAHVIPDIIRKCLEKQYPLEILGSGNQTRCFTHVSDLALGVIMAMESPKAENQDFNLGSEKEIKMIDLAKQIFLLCGVDKPFKVKKMPGFKHDIKRRVPSAKKAFNLLGWKQTVSLNDELPLIVDWVKNYIKTPAKR
jgi:UDP-glucose 4-epimerase